MKNNSKIVLLFLFIILCFLPLQLAQSVSYIFYYSTERESPVIDGNIDDGPWSISSKNLRLYNLSDQTDYIDVSFKSIFNDTDEIVSIGLKIPSTVSNDVLVFTFQNNPSTPLLPHDLPWRFNSGNDQKVVNLQDDSLIDRFTNGVDLEGTADSSVGGTDDFECVSTHDGSNYNIEFVAPLFSEDSNGYDFDLLNDNSTQFFIWFYDDATQTTYSQILETDQSRDYCYLSLSRSTYTINTLLILGSFVSSFILFVSVRTIIRRRVST